MLKAVEHVVYVPLTAAFKMVSSQRKVDETKQLPSKNKYHKYQGNHAWLQAWTDHTQLY